MININRMRPHKLEEKGSHFVCISRTNGINYGEVVYAKPLDTTGYYEEVISYKLMNRLTGETICTIDANTFKNRFEAVQP